MIPESRVTSGVCVLCVLLAVFVAGAEETLDLSSAVIVVRPGELPNAERTAAVMLTEEVESRTGIPLDVATKWPDSGVVIALSSQTEVPDWDQAIPTREGDTLPERRADGYRLFVDKQASGSTVVWIVGADARGVLYGVGALLRNLNCTKGHAVLSASLDIATAPAYPIRGHQLGYRPKANSWDAWTPEQFDQYIRELTFFGVNSIENIPFQGAAPSPLMKTSRQEMNRKMSEICARYGLDYWIWAPAVFDLNDQEKRAALLEQHEELYRDCEELSGIFFPGGDPGSNPPELVLPFLKDVYALLHPIHPDAGVWLSLQGFGPKDIKYVIDYLKEESPDWLMGLVAGPSAPPIPMTRNLLPAKYKYRLYPDITHNKICQYPVPWWDQAYALTLGREAINPRPEHYAYIHNWFAPYTDGFISYSDGVHDDVNKTVWSSLAWDPETELRWILIEYCRVFFGPGVAKRAADGIFALERNWRGTIKENGAVESTLLYWQQLEKEFPSLKDNWRWQMCLVRAYYDAYIRHRVINETRLEEEANAVLAQCESLGADAAMTGAMHFLNQAVDAPVSPELRERIYALCEDLFQSIGLQTSVEKYHASGAERGAILDFVDYPMNNRWWLEDEFVKVRALPSEAEKCKRLLEIAFWERPTPGSYYDDIGNPAKCPRVKRSEFVYTEPGEEAHPEPLQWWWDSGMSRARLSWQNTMDYPEAVVYEGLDPEASYTVRCSGYGKFLLSIDGEKVGDPKDAVEMGETRDYPVAPEHLHDRKLVLKWAQPTDEGHLNWRQRSRLAEVWLITE